MEMKGFPSLLFVLLLWRMLLKYSIHGSTLVLRLSTIPVGRSRGRCSVLGNAYSCGKCSVCSLVNAGFCCTWYALASALAKTNQKAQRRLHWVVCRATRHPPRPSPTRTCIFTRARVCTHMPHFCYLPLVNRVRKATGRRQTAVALPGGGGRVGGAARGPWIRETTTRSKQTPPWPCCRLSRAGKVGKQMGSKLR